MADGSQIEWLQGADGRQGATWNIVTGCSLESPGCKHCYAMKLAGTRMRSHPSRAGLTVDTPEGPVWNGDVRFNENWLTQPLHWRRPRRIFVAAHGDLFHPKVPDEWIDQVFAVMALASNHVFMVLTKRPARMREYTCRKTASEIWHVADRIACDVNLGEGAYGDMYLRGGPLAAKWPLRNVWCGTSIEDQRRADERIPELLATPAAIRWVSAEPLLGPIDLTNLTVSSGLIGDPIPDQWDALDRQYNDQIGHRNNRIDLVIAGGESNSDRPCHPDWLRSLRDQCVRSGTKFFFKQWGDWLPDSLLDNTSKRGMIMRADGRRATDADMPALMNGTFDATGYQHFSEVGKKAAGRVLDGREWSEMPE